VSEIGLDFPGIGLFSKNAVLGPPFDFIICPGMSLKKIITLV
jgi:hypothetical protein